jgi:quercetin dioxygenase-like cupin family protein
MKRIHVDEIESLPITPGEPLSWKPVRHALGVDAFGINAYHGESEGDLVVEDHADRHQELYLVLRGAARFRAGGEEFEAPAGTFVLFQPGEQRVAHAAEPETVVVAIGAEEKRFDPSEWEFAFRAYGLSALGRQDEAYAALDEGMAQYPGSGRLLYDRACLEALAGDREAALEHLREALERRPELADLARTDEDLNSVRDDPRFELAVAGKPGSGGAGA